MDGTQPRGNRRILVRLCVVLSLMAACLASADAAETVEWLQGRLGSDGRIHAPGDMATPFQSTAEAVRALAAETPDWPGLDDAGAYLDGDPHATTTRLARRVLARRAVGTDAGAVITRLLEQQNRDGGFGERRGFHSTALDTALALEALAVKGGGNGEAIAGAVSFLAAAQGEGGGWPFAEGQPASVYVTARVVAALWPARRQLDVAGLIGRARDFLLGERDPGGGWGNTLDTAMVLAALAPTTPDRDPLEADGQRLEDARLANGSWDDDVFLTALALRALAAAAAPYADFGVIDGRVIDGETGASLQGVAVRLDGGAGHAGATNGQGRFRLADIPPGSYELSLAREGYREVSTAIAVRAGSRIDMGTLRLLRAAGDMDTTTVTGRVTRADNGDPIRGVMVGVVGTSHRSETDADGRYQIDSLPPGEVTLSAERAGFRGAEASAKLVAGQVSVFSPALRQAASRGVTIRGRAVRQDDGTPVEEVLVTVARDGTTLAERRTDATGAYRIEGLSPGAFSLTAEHGDYWPVSAAATGGEQAVLQFSPELRSITEEPPPVKRTGGVRLVVRDAVSGQTLEGAEVTVSAVDGAHSGRTNAEGELLLDGLPAGAATLVVSASGFRERTASMEIPAGAVLVLGEVALRPVGQGDKADVSGRVIDAAHGEPLRGVRVEAVFGGETESMETPADGRFALSGLDGGAGRLRLSHPGHEPVELGLILIPGRENDTGDLRMRPAAVTELRPDLVVESLDASALRHDPQTLAVDGTIEVGVGNAGSASADAPVEVLVYRDTDADGAFDPDTDKLLGADLLAVGPDTGEVATLRVPVDGQLPFRDAPVRVWVDSGEAHVELDEANNHASSAGSCGADEDGVVVDLAMCMDGSGSVSGSDFQLQLEGTAAAVENPDVFPHDGSVRLTALQFSSGTRLEIAPTPITRESAPEVAERIRDIRKRGGGTSIHSCIKNATATLQEATPASAIQVIDVSTDGRSSQGAAERAAADARDAGIDTLNAIGVGSGIDEGLLEAIVFPKPPGGRRGFVELIDEYAGYEEAIFAKVDREVRVIDLTVGGLAVADGGADDSVSVSMVIGNAGSGDSPSDVAVRLHAFNVDGDRVWEDDLTVGALPAGAFQRVVHAADLPPGAHSVTAVIDPAEEVTECNRGNNKVESTVGTHLGALSLETDADTYRPASEVGITVTLRNEGALQGRFRPVLRVADGAGTTVTELADPGAYHLAPAESTELSLSWPAGDRLAGAYRVSGVLLDRDGETVDQAVAPFRIVHGDLAQPLATLDLGSDRPVYHVSDEVLLESLVNNDTGNTMIRDAELRITVTGPGDRIVFTTKGRVSALGPSAQRRLFDELVLEGAEEGVYRAQGELISDSDTLLAGAVTEFEVAAEPDRAIVGKVDVIPGDAPGEPSACRFTVRNHGPTDFPALAVRYLQADAEQARSRRLATATLELLAGEAHEETHPATAWSGNAEGHHCVLRARVGSRWRTLDYARLPVRKAPVAVDVANGPALAALVAALALMALFSGRGGRLGNGAGSGGGSGRSR
ncbi:carboxypeptidase regulatory-like domain-containing protein [Arhodomonas sp. SL1]|uniref:carboxypeptidase regulatory-like domain-containing protein n=1 Tax=Arhodomonas sp. SL1 TaxID=3425691 RepID=UPI003F8831C7